MEDKIEGNFYAHKKDSAKTWYKYFVKEKFLQPKNLVTCVYATRSAVSGYRIYRDHPEGLQVNSFCIITIFSKSFSNFLVSSFIYLSLLGGKFRDILVKLDTRRFAIQKTKAIESAIMIGPHIKSKLIKVIGKKDRDSCHTVKEGTKRRKKKRRGSDSSLMDAFAN